MRRFIAALGATVFFCIPMFAFADTVQVNFESPAYIAGQNINGQNGWSNTGLFDANVVTSGGANFGSQSLQISDAKTSGSFGDQTFAPALATGAGETGVAPNNHFEAQFDIASMLSDLQSGLTATVSPDDGNGSRMSYLRFEDQADGIHVFFDDVTDPTSGTAATFNESDIATISRSPHTIKFVMDFVDGPANDVVKIYIDGVLKKTGGSWEDYYRNDPEQSGNGNTLFPVKTLLFREKGTPHPVNSGKGFLIDNLTITSGTRTTGSVVVVTPVNTQGWSTADTRPGGAVNYLTDATTPAGTAALQLTTDNTTAAKAQYMHLSDPIALSSVSELSYYTKQNSASFAGGEASYQLPVYLKGGTDGFTTFVFEPYENGSPTPNMWQYWDVAKGQFWSSKTVDCSNGTINAGAGGPPFYTLSQIEATCPSAVVTGFGVNVGTYNPSYDVETDLVSFNNTAYDFEPAPTPTTAKVTIYKYIDGQHATAENANNAIFPFTATYNASNIGSGSDPFTIGATGNNVSTGNPYEVQTIPLALGATYSASENVTGNDVVGATCEDGKPFALAGYSSGDTFDQAFVNASSSTAAPQFTNLQSDKVLIVWNKTCPTAPPAVPQVHIFKFVDGVQATAANNTATFPMNASWVSSTLGTVPSVGFTLSPTGWGASDAAYEASYVGGAAGDQYATNEVLTTPTVGQSCDGSHTYALEGYTTGDTLEEAQGASPTLESPNFNDLQTDEYVIVWNKTCPTTASLTITKSSIGGNGTFNFTSDIPGHASFQITTSNNTGSVTFDNIPFGTYHVTEVNQPKGWTQTDNTCSDIALPGDGSACTVIDTNNKLLGSIRGSKFEDWDGDGSAFETKWEKGLKGWTIYIDKNDNGQLDSGEMTATTDKNGLYIFSGLPAGTYTIREVQQAGWTQTYPSTNALNDKWVVHLNAGQNVKKKDFGNFKLGSISGMKFNDLNGNGHREAAKEPGLSGITIKLKGPNGVVSSTVTDASGNYHFDNLGPGKYTLSEVVPPGWRQTLHPGSVRVVSGTNSGKENFGNTQKPLTRGHGHGGDDDHDN